MQPLRVQRVIMQEMQMFFTAQEADEESRMSDGSMADNKELMILFFNERCKPLYLEKELVAIEIDTIVITKKLFTCNSCHVQYITFLETPPKYCVLHSPKCELCSGLCPNGTIEDLCVKCYKEELG